MQTCTIAFHMRHLQYKFQQAYRLPAFTWIQHTYRLVARVDIESIHCAQSIQQRNWSALVYTTGPIVDRIPYRFFRRSIQCKKRKRRPIYVLCIGPMHSYSEMKTFYRRHNTYIVQKCNALNFFKRFLGLYSGIYLPILKRFM